LSEAGFLLIIGGCGLLLLMLLLGLGVCHSIVTLQKAKLGLETQLNEALAHRVEAQLQEIAYLRDWRVLPTDIVCDEKLAAGAEGEVWRGTLHGHEGPVAVKRATGMAADSTGKPVWTEREVAFLMGMQHDRVVTFIGAGEMPHPSDPSIPILFTVMEYMSGGSLNYRLWDKPHQSVTWRERLTWALDTAEGMAFIASKGFAHRDLKTQNILYDHASGRAKVADFGSTRRVHLPSPEDTPFALDVGSTNKVSMMTARGIGTCQYLGPEICSNYVAIDAKVKNRTKSSGSHGVRHGDRHA